MKHHPHPHLRRRTQPPPSSARPPTSPPQRSPPRPSPKGSRSSQKHITFRSDHGLYGPNPEAPFTFLPFARSFALPALLCYWPRLRFCMVAMGGARRLRAGAGDGGGGAAGHPHGRHQGFVRAVYLCYPASSKLLILGWGSLPVDANFCSEFWSVLCVGADAEIDPSESGIATTARCFQILLSPQVVLLTESSVWHDRALLVIQMAMSRAVCLSPASCRDFCIKCWFFYSFDVLFPNLVTGPFLFTTVCQDDDFDEAAYVPGKLNLSLGASSWSKILNTNFANTPWIYLI